MAEAGRGRLFPTGPQVRLGPVIEREVEPQGRLDSRAYLDLDTGKVYECLEGFRPQTEDEDKDCYAFWLPAAGIDALVDQAIRVEGGRREGTFITGGRQIPLGYRLSGEGTRVWRVADDLWDRIDETVRRDQLELPPAVQADFYARSEGAELTPAPMTFLFITREGGRGILQVVANGPENPQLRLQYRLWAGTGKLPAGPASTRPSFEGARFAEEREQWVAGPTADKPAGLDLDTGRTVLLPKDAELPPYKSPGAERLRAFEAMQRWAETTGVDLVGSRDVNDALVGVRALHARVAEVSPEAWETMTAQHVVELLQRRLPRPEGGTLGYKVPQAYVFQTREGAMAIVQVAEIDRKTDRVRLRYRRIQLPESKGESPNQ